MNKISNIQITLETGPNGECLFCKGKGYFCVKQGPVAINDDGFKIYPSITIGCPWCHGTGKAKDHNQQEDT